ncbi:MAG: phage holin [Clostridia bacterium]|nr:phage holin [Clostridia bacterium]
MNCTKETWIRTAALLVALLNQILTVLGKNPLPFSEEEIYQVLSLAATTAAGLWAWWKNNSFTAAAVEADRYLAELKGKE